jgi:hypothetical protein
MKECAAWKAYAARMYREREEPLNVLLGPWLGEGNDPLKEFCIVTEGSCLAQDLDVRASNVGLPIKISKCVVKAKNSRGPVIVSKIIHSSKSH